MKREDKGSNRGPRVHSLSYPASFIGRSTLNYKGIVLSVICISLMPFVIMIDSSLLRQLLIVPMGMYVVYQFFCTFFLLCGVDIAKTKTHTELCEEEQNFVDTAKVREGSEIEKVFAERIQFRVRKFSFDRQVRILVIALIIMNIIGIYLIFA